MRTIAHMHDEVINLVFCFLSFVITVFNMAMRKSFGTPQPEFTGNLISYPYSGNTKYYIAACFKLDGYYLEDWIKYHLAIGIDGIFICDNNKDDEDLEYVERVKSQYAKVEVIDKRNLPFKQVDWYGDMYMKIRPGDWCFFIDVDEFLTFPDGMSLYHYMSLARQTPCQQIKINWMVYGNNKQIFMQPGSLRDRFPKPITVNGTTEWFDENHGIKALLLGGLRLRFRTMHHAIGRGLYGCKSDFVKMSNHVWWSWPTHRYVYLRHYKGKSEQEFCLKIRKWRKIPDRNVDRYEWSSYNSDNKDEPNQPRTGIIDDNCNVMAAYKHLVK